MWLQFDCGNYNHVALSEYIRRIAAHLNVACAVRPKPPCKRVCRGRSKVKQTVGARRPREVAQEPPDVLCDQAGTNEPDCCRDSSTGECLGREYGGRGRSCR